MKTLAGELHRLAQEQGDQTALTLLFPDTPPQSLTYREFYEQALGWAATFQRKGIQAGEIVIVIRQHDADLPLSFWGAVLLGAIPSILPFPSEKLDPDHYRESIEKLIDLIHPAGLVIYPELSALLGTLNTPQSSLKGIFTEPDSQPSSEMRQSPPGLSRQPDDLALLQHSSGSTGLQKGVALSHQALFNQLEAYREAVQLQPSDVVTSWLPLYHDMGLIPGFLMPILWNIPLVLMSPFDWVRSPSKILRALHEHRGTLAWMPNFAYNFCASKITDEDMAGIDLSHVRAFINCSEPTRLDSHQMFYERFKSHGLRFEMLTTSYAMAENVFGVTQSGFDGPVAVDVIDRAAFMEQHQAVPASDGAATLTMLSAGTPVKGVEVKVLDADRRDCTERQVGEIALRSDCMLTGYFNRPDATEQAFHEGWYLTGDLGYLAEGNLYVTGRKKDIIIIGGKNVYPQDIETLVSEVEGVHPGRVVAFGITDERIGTEELVVLAEPNEANPAESGAIVRRIRTAVATGSDVVARYVQVVEPMSLLKTSSGKIARSANKERFLNQMNGKGGGG